MRGSCELPCLRAPNQYQTTERVRAGAADAARGSQITDAEDGVAAPAQPAEQSLPALLQLFTAYKHARSAALHCI